MRGMCIARVGRVLVAAGGKGRVEFFDGRTMDGVDLAVAGAGEGDFVEVFGNLALGTIAQEEARVRKKAWKAVRRAAAVQKAGARRP